MLNKSYSNLILECGTDEAGRGCLAGPVTAAAVILPNLNFGSFCALLLVTKKMEQRRINSLLRFIIIS